MSYRTVYRVFTQIQIMKIRDGGGGDLEIKIIDFLVSGSESIELLSRSLPSLVDWGIYLNDKRG